METAKQKLIECCGDEAIAELLGLASGVMEAVEGERGAPEIAWAAREFADELADVQPLIMVFEDIHWAEEPLLELIDHLAQWVRERALLILCLARPELLDVRPGWGGGRVRSTAIELEPLGREDSEALADALLEEHQVTGKMRARLLDKAEGNPLFVEETVRMLLEQGADGERQDSRFAPGDDRRAHRQTAGRREDRAAARLGDRTHLLGRRDRPPLAGVRRGRARGPARRPALARPRHTRRAFDDRRRGGVSLQARAHPRGRVRRSVEVRARRIPHTLRRVAAREGGQGSDRDPCVSPRPGVPALRRARRTSSRGARAHRGEGTRGPRASARSRSNRTSRRASFCFAPWSSSRLWGADFSPRALPGSSEIFRSCATR